MAELARSLEFQVADVERELSVASSNFRRAATVTDAASHNLKRLEKEAGDIRQRLTRAKIAGLEPGFRYDLGPKSQNNIVRAEILVECCRESIYVMSSRVEKYDDQFGKLSDECNKCLVDVDIRRNEEEDMFKIPRADKYHLPRPGSFEIYLQYFVPIPEPPKEEPAEAEEFDDGEAAEEPKSPTHKKPKETATLIRLFSKLQTKKWPNIAKVMKGVRMFLPLQFDKLAKEEEEARLAAIQARIEDAKQRVADAKKVTKQQTAAAEGKIKEAEETRGASSEVLEAYEKMKAEKHTMEQTIADDKERLMELMKALKALQTAAAEGDEAAEGKVGKAEATVKSCRRQVKEGEANLVEFEAPFEESKTVAEAANSRISTLQAEYDAIQSEITTGNQELNSAIADQEQLHRELGIPLE